MEVIIDGVLYCPAPEKAVGNSFLDALEIRFDSDAGENITIRDYLYKLLFSVWNEGESFNGKRPFGNSGWEYDLYTPLVKAGFIKGTYEEDYGVDGLDKDEAAEYVFSLIKAVFYGIKD